MTEYLAACTRGWSEMNQLVHLPKANHLLTTMTARVNDSVKSRHRVYGLCYVYLVHCHTHTSDSCLNMCGWIRLCDGRKTWWCSVPVYIGAVVLVEPQIKNMNLK